MVADFGLPAEGQFHFDRGAIELVADHLIRPLATAACSFARTSGHLALSLNCRPPCGGQGISLKRARGTASDPKQISTELNLEVS